MGLHYASNVGRPIPLAQSRIVRPRAPVQARRLLLRLSVTIITAGGGFVDYEWCGTGENTPMRLGVWWFVLFGAAAVFAAVLRNPYLQ